MNETEIIIFGDLILQKEGEVCKIYLF